MTVLAEVVPVCLELSCDEVELQPSLGLPAEAGIRGVISLRNPLNQAAEFTWNPILGERGTAFSIRPATGRKLCVHKYYLLSVIGVTYGIDDKAHSWIVFTILDV